MLPCMRLLIPWQPYQRLLYHLLALQCRARIVIAQSGGFPASAGFGCVCTIATCSWPFFKQAAIMNMAYPLFILVACKSDPLKAYKEGVPLCHLALALPASSVAGTALCPCCRDEVHTISEH